jgi:rhodanese-related sulfurtransferase
VSRSAAITREELQAKLERRDAFFLFEVLPLPYYRKHHLPGAIHLPPNDIIATVERIVPQRDADIVLYCWDDH